MGAALSEYVQMPQMAVSQPFDEQSEMVFCAIDYSLIMLSTRKPLAFKTVKKSYRTFLTV